MTLQATVDKPDAKSTFSPTYWLDWIGRTCVLLAILISPWLFGGYYFSAKFMITILMLIGLATLWFEVSLSNRKSLVMPMLLIPVMLGIGIVFFQLLELPESMDSFLGRQKELYSKLSVKGEQAGRSISMYRLETWDRLGLLLLSVAGVTLGARYFRTNSHAKLLLTAGTINGVAISLFGMVQSLTGGNQGTIYWVIKLLRGGIPFGPYVNRNNASGYLLICLACALGLAAVVLTNPQKESRNKDRDLFFWAQFKIYFLKFVSELNAVKIAILFAIVLISAGVIASLSRGGTAAMLAGFLATLTLYGVARRPRFLALIVIPAGVLILLLGSWLGFGDQLMKRFEHDSVRVTNQNLRIKHWTDTWPAISDFGAFGSGVGAYEQVHRIYRSDSENVIFQYAENQFFQTAVEMGWPGLAVLLIAWLMVGFIAMFLLFRGNSPVSIGLGVAGVFSFFAVFVASLFDFGLYLPANMSLMAVICGFLAFHAQSLGGRLKKRSWIRFETPNTLAKGFLAVLFLGLSMYGLDFYKKWTIESAIREYPLATFTVNYPDVEETERLIKDIAPLVEKTQNLEGLTYVAELFIHRCRVNTLDELINTSGTSLDSLNEESRNNIWDRTSLDGLHEMVWALQDDGNLVSQQEFRQFIRGDLEGAKNYLRAARRVAPMHARTHLLLAQVNALVGTSVDASRDSERAIFLAPKKPNYRFVAGLCYLQARKINESAVHLREMMILEPRTYYSRIRPLTFGGSNRSLPRVDYELLASEIMPDNAKLLYDVACDLPENADAARAIALERADGLLQNISASNEQDVLLKAEVKLKKGEIASAIEIFQGRLDSKPSDYGTHLRTARLLIQVRDLEEAKSKLEYILLYDSNENRLRKCRKLLEQVSSQISDSPQSPQSFN